MDEDIILAREQAHALLDLLWFAYEQAVQSLHQAEAMQLMEMIEEIERKLWS